MQCESAAHHRSGKPSVDRSRSGRGRPGSSRPDGERLGAALDRVAVGLDVDAPGLVGDQLARLRRRAARRESTCSTGGSAPSSVSQRRWAAARPRPPAGTSRSTSAGRDRRCHRGGGRRAGRAGRAFPRGCAIQGPTAITTCSTSIGPALVWTAVTAPEPSSSNPVTSTPSAISRRPTRALSARPRIDSWLKAKPPACSCRQTLRPSARQSAEQPAHVGGRRPARR